jgi:hypothetical protein
MIKTELQRDITIKKIQGLKEFLSMPKSSTINPKLARASEAQTQSLINDLETEVQKYDEQVCQLLNMLFYFPKSQRIKL